MAEEKAGSRVVEEKKLNAEDKHHSTEVAFPCFPPSCLGFESPDLSSNINPKRIFTGGTHVPIKKLN